MTGDESFEGELRRWVYRLYQQRELLAAERSRVATERLFDRERHLLNGLSAQLLVTIVLLPWWGVWGVAAGLATLYIGSLISGAVTLWRERELSPRRTPEMLLREAEQALADCPKLDTDARALLIRIMNLADLPPSQRSLELLRQDVRDVLGMPTLAGWRVLGELLALIESPEWVRLGLAHSRTVGSLRR